LFYDLVESGDWITGRGISIFLQLDRRAVWKEARGATPFVNAFLAALGHFLDVLKHSEFFRRNHVNERIASTDERFEFLGEFSSHGCSMRKAWKR
jgi:hypothetical protein